MASTTEIYNSAIQHHRAGDIDRAEQLYREIIRIDAGHADAVHLLGVAAHQRGRNEQAVEYISQAIRLNSRAPSFHSNLGAAYRGLGNLDRAVESLQTAVRIDDDYAEGHENLGILLTEQGRHEEANRSLQRAQQLKQSSTTASTTAPEFVWQGVYQSFAEVPVRGGGHEGNNWAQATYEENRKLREVAGTYNTIPFQTFGFHSYLPMLAGIVQAQQQTVRILDFGGATGTALPHLLAAMNDPSGLELHVVETDSTCRLGEELWSDEPRVTFHRSMADAPRQFDIVHVNSALQYVEDYRAVLEELCGFAASWVFLPRLSAGDFPTYATAQMNLWNDVVAYWFINVGELIGIVEECGYRLLSKSVEGQLYDQSNFPAEYRMHRACNLLFGRNGDNDESEST